MAGRLHTLDTYPWQYQVRLFVSDSRVNREFMTLAQKQLSDSLVFFLTCRAVVNHFKPKVESWASVNHLSSLTEEQVLEVVKTNYDTLTLKVHDNLDQFERYSEKPMYTNFFLLMVSSQWYRDNQAGSIITIILLIYTSV